MNAKRIRVRPKGEKQIDEPSTWWTESRLSYLMRQGDAQAVIWSKIRRLSSRRPLGLSMASLDVNHPLPGDFGPLCPQIYLIFPDLSRERIFIRISLPEAEKSLSIDCWIDTCAQKVVFEESVHKILYETTLLKDLGPHHFACHGQWSRHPGLSPPCLTPGLL